MNKKANIVLISVAALLIFGVLVFLFLKSSFTGFAVMLSKNVFMPNESLTGIYSLKLREGELLPLDARVRVSIDGKTKELSLRQWLDASGVNYGIIYGNFYSEKANISGYGEGIGRIGKHIDMPNINFKLRIITEKTEEKPSKPKPKPPEENLTPGNVTPPSINITPINITPINQTNLTNITLPNATNISQPPNFTNITKPNITLPEENITKPEITKPEENISEVNVTNETLLSRFARAIGPLNFFYFLRGLRNTVGVGFIVKESEINGKVNAREPFIYELGTNQHAELVPGSVEINGITVDDSLINIEKKPGFVMVTTNYSIESEGFGKDFLGKSYGINLSLDVLNLTLPKEGIYDLVIEISYNNKTIAKEIKKVAIALSPENITNITNLTKPNITIPTNITNITKLNITQPNITKVFVIKLIDAKGRIIDEIRLLSNETKGIKLKVSEAGKIEVEKSEEESGKESKGKEGVEIRELSLFPFAKAQIIPICGNNACETNEDTLNCPEDCPLTVIGYKGGNLTLQKGMPTQELIDKGIITEVIASAQGFNAIFDKIYVRLNKTVNANVSQILKCRNWDSTSFNCLDSFTPVNAWFEDRGNYIILNITSFSAYAGGAGYNASLAIWDTSDSKAIGINQSITFYANYSKWPSGEAINDSEGNCSIIFNFENAPSFYIDMRYNAITKLWEYSFITQSQYVGNNTFTVTCNSSYGNLTATDSFVINNWTSISYCQSITSPGYYVLTQNLSSEGTCINIQASNVVLDCQGHSINHSGYGIYGNGIQNITIKNCEIVQGIDTGCPGGIFLSNSSIINITHNNIFDYCVVIHLTSSINAEITHNNLSLGMENEMGSVQLEFTNYTNISFNELVGPGLDVFDSRGIYLFSSNYNTIFSNTIYNHSSDGIYLSSSTYNKIYSNNIYDNGGGISLDRSNQTNITLNTIYNNDGGIGIFDLSSNNYIASNAIHNNVYEGILVWLSSYNIIYSNNITFNNPGIYLEETSNNTIYNNLFNNTLNFNLTNSHDFWNTTKQEGRNIIGGRYLGGNFWAKPDGTGFSETCSDNDGDGICDSPYVLTTNNTDYLPLAAPAPIGGACFNITAPGYYALNKDIVADRSPCINIKANNVVLDCQGNWIFGSGNGEAINSSGINVTVKNCKIKDFDYGFVSPLAYGYAETIVNNYFENMNVAAIDILKAWNATVKNNTIINANTAIGAAYESYGNVASDYVIIEDNVIRYSGSASGSGISLRRIDIPLYVRNNYVEGYYLGPHGNGILIGAFNNPQAKAYIEGNTLKNNYDCIFLTITAGREVDNAIIKDNIIDNCQSSGIGMGGSKNISLINNTIKNANKGIWVFRNAENIIGFNNSIYNSYASDIYADQNIAAGLTGGYEVVLKNTIIDGSLIDAALRKVSIKASNIIPPIEFKKVGQGYSINNLSANANALINFSYNEELVRPFSENKVSVVKYNGKWFETGFYEFKNLYADENKIELKLINFSDFVPVVRQDSCFDILYSGTFTLNTNITNITKNPCINIQASNVVLDCQGKAIIGNDTTLQSYTAINVKKSNITVKNCYIEKFNTSILINPMTDINIDNNYMKDVMNGIILKVMPPDAFPWRVNLTNNKIVGWNAGMIQVSADTGILVNGIMVNLDKNFVKGFNNGIVFNMPSQTSNNVVCRNSIDVVDNAVGSNLTELLEQNYCELIKSGSNYYECKKSPAIKNLDNYLALDLVYEPSFNNVPIAIINLTQDNLSELTPRIKVYVSNDYENWRLEDYVIDDLPNTGRCIISISRVFSYCNIYTRKISPYPNRYAYCPNYALDDFGNCKCLEPVTIMANGPYASCSNLTFMPYKFYKIEAENFCYSKSKVYARHTQELIKPSNKTGINLVPLTINFRKGVLGISNANNVVIRKFPKTLTADSFLNTLIDVAKTKTHYMSLWSPEGQVYVGHPASKILGVKLRDFPLKPGHAYFIDVPENMNLSMFGEIAWPLRFEIKANPPYYENVIVVPLNSSMKYLREICSLKDVNGSGFVDQRRAIEFWDVINQRKELLLGGLIKCEEINDPNLPFYNYSLPAKGTSYIVVVNKSTYVVIP